MGCARPAPPGRGKISLGDEELGRHGVAEPLHLGSRLLVAGRVAHAGLRERQVAHLVQQRERLRALRVAAVDEDDGGEGVGEREAAKLRHAEGAVRVVADDPVDGNGDAGGLDPVLEQSERLGGAPAGPRPVGVEPEKAARVVGEPLGGLGGNYQIGRASCRERV